jgi:outer membrane protein assembly factor BamB
VVTPPPGVIRPLSGPGQAAVFDTATATLVVLGPGPADTSSLTTMGRAGPPRTVPLTAAATAIAGDGAGAVYVSGRGGYFRFDIATGVPTRFDVEDEQGTDFTAVARRADGKVVLGSADGTVYTLSSPTAVEARLKIFAKVDSLVAQGDNTLVLDRSQTSVTSVDPSGERAEHALRAGEGATNMTLDAAGRVLVTDTRGEGLLVFGTDPLILRQRYPVRDAPYALAGSKTLTWVSQTATNVVIGYDLATGIPVEKVRHRTVRQPNSLAFDDVSGTLYVVSGSGAGVQVIPNAADVP